MTELKRCVGQMSDYWQPVTDADRDALEGMERIEVITDKPRTGKQNNSMWKYCEQLAVALNDAGFDVRTFPWKDGLEIPFSKHTCMERFWRPVMDAMAGVDSTTDQSTKDVMAVYAAVDRAISTKTGVTVAWPCRETQEWEARSKAA